VKRWRYLGVSAQRRRKLERTSGGSAQKRGRESFIRPCRRAGKQMPNRLLLQPKRHRHAGPGINQAYMQKLREGNCHVCTINREKDGVRCIHPLAALRRAARPRPTTETKKKSRTTMTSRPCHE
jgi:hypothetical protein